MNSKYFNAALPFMADPFGYLTSIMRHVDESRRKEQKLNFGITEVEGKEGVERLGIPHKYDTIAISKDYYLYCLIDGKTHVYTKEGKFCFECTDAMYYTSGMFLVCNPQPNEIPIYDRYGYSLYCEEKKLTEAVFSPRLMDKFNPEGFTIVSLHRKSMHSAVINREGSIVVQEDSIYSPYLYGAVCRWDNKFYNLHTGEMICKGYQSLDSKEYLFVKVEENCVFQISRATAEFVIHGEPPKTEEEKKEIAKQAPPLPKPEPYARRIQRNEPCPFCAKEGIEVKFKNCTKHFGAITHITQK